MKRIYKSMIRDIWFSKSRSLAIVVSIIIIISFPMALLDLSPNLGNIISREEVDYKLAHFDVIYTKRTDVRAQEKIVDVMVNDLNFTKEEFDVQSRTYIRMKTLSNGEGALPGGEWLPIDLIGYNMSDPPRINIPFLVDGRFPTKDGEITLLDSYALKDGIVMGDNISVQLGLAKKSFIVVGLVKSVEFASYDISQVAAGYVVPEAFKFVAVDIDTRPYTDTLVYIKSDPPIDELRDIYMEIFDSLQKDGSIPNVALFWFSRETSFRQGLQDSLKLTSKYMLVAAMFIFAVAAIVIYVVTNRSVTEQKKILGAMYAFGNNKSTILKGYLLKSTILGVIGTLFGILVSIFLLDSLVAELGDSWGLINTYSQISQSSFALTIAAAIAISYGSTFLAISNISRLTPYEAMRGKTTELKSGGILFSIINFFPVKIVRISLRDMTRSRTRTLLTVLAFTISLTFAWSLYYAEDSLNFTVTNYYQNNTNYDVDIDLGIDNVFNTELMEKISNKSYVESVEPFMNYLVTFEDFPERMTYMNIIRRNTTMITLDESSILEGRWFERNTSEIVISQYIAGNYGVKIGQNLSLIALGEKIEGTVVGITNDMMFTLSLWMEYDYAASRINPLNGPLGELPFVNHLLIRLKDGTDPKTVLNDLNTNEPVRLVFTEDYYKRRMQTLVNTQAAVIFLMSSLGLIVGSVSVFSTFLIAIVEREREIALKRVFGKSRLEVGLQILVEAVLLVLIALLPSFFIAKSIAADLWLGIVASTIFAATPYFPLDTDLTITGFALLTGIISVVVSVYLTTRIKIVEGIREE